MAQQEHYSLDDWWDEPPVSKHRAGIGGFFGQMWAFLFFAALLAGMACIGFFVPAKEGPMVGLIVGICCSLGAVAMIAWGLVRWAGLIKHVDVHNGGVVWRDAGGRQMAGWDDIKDFYRTEIIVNGATNKRQVAIKTHDRHEAVFTFALGNWKKLADRIQYEVTMRQAPRALAEYEAGESVRFGKGLAISMEGLTLGGKTVPWDRVKRVQVRNGYIIITHGRGDMLEFPIGETPNFPVLLKLLEISPAGLGVGQD